VEPTVLRLFRFRPSGPGFDATMREVLIPDLLRLPGIRGVFAGRVGPDDVGDRLVASLWASEAEMAAGLGCDLDALLFHCELLPKTTDRRLDVRSIAFAATLDPAADVGIIRVVEGAARPGELADYVADVRDGTLADRAAGIGPSGLYLGIAEPDRFVTLSLWDAWSHVEAATGADIGRVDRTRHQERLDAWSAEHYEVVPGIAVVVLEEPEGMPAA
jgi:hypothetical protein